MTRLLKDASPARFGTGQLRTLAPVLVLLGAAAECFAQGTMEFTFEAVPRGAAVPVSSYTESGMHFWNAHSPANLILTGGGIASTPENGTGYLQVPGGITLAFSFNTFPGTYFSLNSFDAAEIDTSLPGPVTLHVVGYGGMGLVVTNDITTDGINDGTGPLQDFQTFSFDSRFASVSRIEISGGFFSLDNVVISGVPEPSGSTLLGFGSLSGLGYAWLRRKRPTRRQLGTPTAV